MIIDVPGFLRVAIADDDNDPLPSITPDEFVALAFTRRDVFEEYVRASEGVPRDAINILSLAARQAGASGISMENVRVAARLWYERDKQPAVASNPAANDLLL
ncbi:MAG TPA: hypothetical protein VFI31_09055 [Pirellulales bacterium]|nr:hypothetical protein [Pirellulales bacterium]